MDVILKAASKRKGKKPKGGDGLSQLDKISSSAGFSDSYLEEDPTVKEWICNTAPTGDQILQYLASLFPFSRWIFSYNIQWLLGDVIAGRHWKTGHSMIP